MKKMYPVLNLIRIIPYNNISGLNRVQYFIKMFKIPVSELTPLDKHVDQFTINDSADRTQVENFLKMAEKNKWSVIHSRRDVTICCKTERI